MSKKDIIIDKTKEQDTNLFNDAPKTEQVVEQPIVEETIKESIVEEPVVEVKPKGQIWIAKQKFRCIKNFNVLYNVGDLVPYTEDREAKGLIELKK